MPVTYSSSSPSNLSNLRSILAAPELCRELRQLSYNCARHIGVPPAFRDACTSDFLLHLLLLSSRTQHTQALPSPTWLRRCALNHSLDFLRRLQRRNAHETTIPTEETGEMCLTSGISLLETCLLAKECRAWIQRSVTYLTPTQQYLFIHLIVNGETASEVATATGRTAHAVRQARLNLCRQLRILFERQGITEVELREYISLIERGGGYRNDLATERLIRRPKMFFFTCQKLPLTFCQAKTFNGMSAHKPAIPIRKFRFPIYYGRLQQFALLPLAGRSPALFVLV